MNENYVEAEVCRRAIETLHKLAADIGPIRTSLMSVLGAIGDVWQGAAADAFLETSEWTVKDMDKMRTEIENLAKEIAATLLLIEGK